MTDNSLAIIYTFAPNVDTSGIVFAKRIQHQYKERFTVISCRPYKGAPQDETLIELISPYVSSIEEIDAKFTYRDWNHFLEFINKAVSLYVEKIESGEKFTKLYSRSMSVVSHIVAYQIKKISPEIHWVAEFSDPIIKDVNGEDRLTIVPEQWLESNFDLKELSCFRKYNNLFSLSEIITYLYADEVVFTNSLQKDFMLTYLESDLLNLSKKGELIELINSKSNIVAHPTLDRKYYNRVKPELKLNEEVVNIGYFGNLNAQRTFELFFKSWEELDDVSIQSINFHVFTNTNSEKIKSKVPSVLKDVVFIHKGLKYLEFLGVLDEFDYLLSIDSEVLNYHGVNPFLPSKISDYLGSKAKVLALVEQGSPADISLGAKHFKFELENFDKQSLYKVLLKGSS